MGKRIILSALSFIWTTWVHAIVAYPNKVAVQTEDNSHVFIQLKGDEYSKWGITEDGYTVLPTENGWHYAQVDANGFAIASKYKLTSENGKNDDLRAFLKTQPKGLSLNIEGENNNRQNQVSNKALFEDVVYNTSPITGNRKALVVLMSFADLDFKLKREDFDKLFNQVGYKEDGALGSVKDFFLWSSYGKLNFCCDVIGPFKAAHNLSYYGGNSGSNGQDKNPFELFQEALQYATQQINLKDYDVDKDGYVDNFHIIFAGFGEEAGASPNAIWSHEMSFNTIKVQGMNINKYSCAPELRGNFGNGISRIGPHCHEMGHALGAMDYYDTDYETNGNYLGTGKWDIMASGSWNEDGICPPDFNPYVKVYNFGWSSVKTIETDKNVTILPSCEDDNQIYRINTPVNNEFYLLENRRQEGFDLAIPGEGLLIFHIGPHIEHYSKSNKINAKYPQQCYIVCASSEYMMPTSRPSSYGDINKAGCPFPGSSGKMSFTDTTVPSALCIDGTASGIVIENISETSNGYITLNSGDEIAMDNILWSETFEEENWLTRWNQKASSWKLYDEINFEAKDHLGEMPPTVQGNCYIYLKLGSSSIGGDNTGNYEISSSLLGLEKFEESKLSFKYYNSPDLFYTSNFSNILSVYIEQQGKRTLLSSFGNTDKIWNSANINLNIDKSEDLKIIFQGEGRHSGYIGIDNIQISGNIELSSVQPVELSYNNDESLYSLNGIRQTGPIETLTSGIYILCRKNGERKKFLVKRKY